MTKREFIRGYARRSEITVKQFNELGLDAYPCDCGENNCKGWQVQSKETASIRGEKMHKVITRNTEEVIKIQWDGVRFCIIGWERCYAFGGETTQTIFNPREAQETADFINENNKQYQVDLLGKKLRENQECLS